MIELKNITKSFGEGASAVKALDDITLKVPSGAIYGVVGASGAGKSTLIRCVNLLERPSSGDVLVNGQNLVKMNDRELRQTRRDIGMIFQHFNLLSSRTVYDNIALSLELAGKSKAEIREAIEPLLQLTGLDEKRQSYPSQLSGGQKQRVAIARALASKPAVLLCDEATSALDPKTTNAILQLLKDINKQLGITILLITHEMEVVKSICDRVAILHGGRLIEENAVEQFFIQPQTEIAREFVRSALHEKQPAELEADFHKEPREGSRPVVRISFMGHSAVEPLITQAARQFNVDISILQADMETVHGNRMGFLTAELIGDEAATQAATNYLQQHPVQVEVLGYVN
ncbi:methionine ABC transporter ATP-binding protein [Endozoicomonadaceae bacterium StTr2]